MLTSTRRALVVLLGVGLLGGLSLWQTLGENRAAAQAVKIARPIGPGGVPAGPEEQPESNDQNHVLTLVTDTRLKEKVEAGREYIKVSDWPKATHLLQGVLDQKQDAFVPITSKGVDGKEQTQFISAKKEANRLIGTMPADGLDYYKNQYGPQAQSMLKDASDKSDVAMLAEIAQRFLYTDAGDQAITLLATYKLDRGENTIAALYFKALMDRNGADKLPPLTLFKAALAFHALRDDRDKENQENEAIALKELERKAGDGLKLGGNQSVSLREAKQLLDKFRPTAAVANPSDVLTIRGNNAHNAQGNGGIPFTRPRWIKSMYQTNKDDNKEGQVAKWLADAVRMQDTHNQPSLPASQPIAVTVRGDKGAKSMVVYRNYWGIKAVDIKTGDRLWDSASEWSLVRMAEKPDRMNALNQWIGGYISNQTKPSIVFENSTLGTLSSDGTRVYVVEDLAVPPPFIQNFNGGWPQPQPQVRHGKEIDDAVAHSELYAYDLYSGVLKWRLGGRIDPKDDKTHPNYEVKDSYFLGPPLALGGKLYVMTDKNQELRMVCINAAKGEVEWSQPLANTREKMVQDVNRRVQAAQLAYGDGVLVCPTNSGAILGVDLLSHSLLWAYPYREKALDNNPNPGGLGFRPGFGGPAMGPPGNPLATDWQVTPPVVVDGKVVFTAPDASSVICIDLRKGSFLWSEKKAQDDLYLAGVYDGKVLIVSKNNVRALSLDLGKKQWELPTGMPSGQGVASANIYYLPLKGTANDKAQPEICAIDVKAGKVKANTKSRQNPTTHKVEIPGNLLMFEGDVISQGLTEIMAFPQLEVQKQEAEKRLKENPKDPVGLTKRGELYLDEGKRLEAIADLREALAQKTINEETTKQARLKLYESLAELMQNEFDKAEPYLAEFEELCKNPSGNNATEIAAERDRRLINYYCLLAKGREAQEKYTDAFQAYMDFIALTANKKDELVSTADESSVRAAPDVWAAGRIAAMMGAAKGPSKEPLDQLIAKKWEDTSKQGETGLLRQFVAMFGSQFAVGREARLLLAERLMEESGTASLLDAERHLIMLQGQQEDRTMAARAVETYARLLKRKGMLAEAAFQYKILGREFGDVVIRDGKTGADYVNDLAADKFLLPYLDGQHYVMAGKLQVKSEAGQFPFNQQQVFNFECDSESSPFFDKHKLAYNFNFQKFQLLDRQTGEERWGPRLNNIVYFQNFLWNNGMTDKKRFPFQRVGHLVVLNMGNMIFGLDPINKQVLWEKNLLGAQGQPPNSNLMLNPADDMIEIYYPNNYREAIGHLGPAEASYVALLSRDGLIAIDPLTGRTLWTRAGIGARSHLFGDTQHVFVVEVNSDGQTGKAYALRASDGVKLEKAPDFGALYSQRLRIFGRRLLLAQFEQENKAAAETKEAKPAAKPVEKTVEKPPDKADAKRDDKTPPPPEAKKPKLTIRLYDITTGKDAWTKEFPAGSQAIRSDESEVVGAVEPDGKFTLFDLRSLKAIFEAKVDPKYLKDVNDARLFQDSRNYYVALNTPVDQNVNPGGMTLTNIQPTTGMRCTPVNGEFYCFDRETKKMNWHNDIPMNRLLVNHFQDLPMALFTARNNRPAPKGGGWGGQDVSVTSIDKATGKRIYDKTDLPQDYQLFYDMRVDLKNGKIELVGQTFKVTHTIVPPEGAPGDGKKETGPTPPSGGAPGAGPGGGTTPVPIIRPKK
jgi:outer membrane protein assembly factor BamB